MKYFLRIHSLYHKHIASRDKEARFLILVFFTLTFIIARITVYSIRYHWFPSSVVGDIYLNDIHIHHLVFGIILLLIAGIIRIPRWDDNLVRFSSILYGIGAALTLDEFSLWLHLNPDVYFGPQGRISIDAVVLFILISLLTLGYGNFWRRLLDHTILYVWSFIKKRKARKDKGKVTRVLLVILLTGIGTILGGYIFLVHNTFLTVTLPRPSKKNIAALPVVPTATCNKTNATGYGFPLISTTPITTGTIQGKDQGRSSDYCLHIPVLYYHHIQPWEQAVSRKQTTLSVDSQIFDSQMAYLVDHGYTTISTLQLIQALRYHLSLPPKSVVLTFDDAYRDIYTYAFPIFKKYHLEANLAVPTGLLGIHSDTNYYFSWMQLKEMVDSGLVNADDHTWSHFGLGLGDVNKDQFEIMTSKSQLQGYLNKPVDVLVYPYGSYKPSLFPLLARDGILGAFTTNPGTIECSSQIFALPRTRIANGQLSNFGL